MLCDKNKISQVLYGKRIASSYNYTIKETRKIDPNIL